ncbi:MAG: outer membrane protein assembly factor BamB family protein, partial [Planctomycetota bacterium]
MRCNRKSSTLLALVGLWGFAGFAEPSEEAGKSPSDDRASEILEATGAQGGLVVHLGCGDGKLTAALRAGDGYLVHGLDASKENVEEARNHVRSLGIYGPVAVDRFDGKRLPYVDNLVNLLVAERTGSVPADEMTRVLRPGGVAYVEQGGTWKRIVKPQLAGVDEWTHYLHGPDNNAVARDRLVASPFHVQWVGEPRWARHHNHLASVSAMVSSAGRVFAIVDEGPVASINLPSKWRLVARDAFNGVVLWKRPVGPWEGHLRPFRSGPPELARRLVAAADRLYVTLGYSKPLTCLEAATGRVVKTYEHTEGTVEIVHENGVLYLLVGTIDAEQYAESRRRRGASPPPRKKQIRAIRAETGELLWARSDADAQELLPTTLCVDGGRVFFHATGHVICLEAESGEELWRAPRRARTSRLGWSTPTLVAYEDVV